MGFSFCSGWCLLLSGVRSGEFSCCCFFVSRLLLAESLAAGLIQTYFDTSFNPGLVSIRRILQCVFPSKPGASSASSLFVQPYLDQLISFNSGSFARSLRSAVESAILRTSRAYTQRISEGDRVECVVCVCVCVCVCV